MKIAAQLAVVGATLTLGACATVTRGTSTAWEVQTTPPGATVTTSNQMKCDSTPCSLKMARKAEFDAAISKPGYKTVNVHVTHKIAGAGGAAMAGNVLVGGIIGAGVDVGTGAMLDLTPNPVVLNLERDDGVPPMPGGDASVPPPPPAPAMQSNPAPRL